MNNKQMGYVIMGVIMLGIAMSYAAVPLYKIFCQKTGYGGTISTSTVIPKVQLQDWLTINFEGQIDGNLPLRFEPTQKSLKVLVGQTALAFYKVKNLSSNEIYGISTYNVTPSKVGKYFIKIQCFCFDEQRWKPGEEVEMPVLFYIDTSIRQDLTTIDIHDITLSYTVYPTNPLS